MEEDTGVMPITAEDRRQAEIEAGRARTQERMKAAKLSPAEIEAAEKRSQEEHEASEEHRRSVYGAQEEAVSKAERDRAGAEVIDQAQTMLEAVQHLADRNEPIIDMRRERMIERLKEDADPEGARELATDFATAQAVNQPTVLASERGVETEGRPLNTTMAFGGNNIPDERLALDIQDTPSDRVVPKTREKAEEVGRGIVPPAEKVVKAGAVVNDPNPKTVDKGAVAVVRAAPDDILGDGEDYDVDAKQAAKAKAKAKK